MKIAEAVLHGGVLRRVLGVVRNRHALRNDRSERFDAPNTFLELVACLELVVAREPARLELIALLSCVDARELAREPDEWPQDPRDELAMRRHLREQRNSLERPTFGNSGPPTRTGAVKWVKSSNVSLNPPFLRIGEKRAGLRGDMCSAVRPAAR